MGITVDIDNGGTFTDGYVTRGSEIRTVKVDTTPHDLTVCFANCLEEASVAFDYPNLYEFLRNTDVIRFSTTVGTNAIIQRKGPRVGLLVSSGHEVDLYGPDQPSVRDLLVPSNLIVGIAHGATQTEISAGVAHLLERGARLLVVSLEDSFEHPEEERRVKQLIKADYPKQYLGSVPVLLASEVSPRPGALQRTNLAVINAFLHREMVRTLYKADEDLRKAGYSRPLLVAHVNGGAARVAKTRAIDTYNSGPVAGLMGTAYMAKLYGLPNVVSIDIGGTSTDVGVIAAGKYSFDFAPTIEGLSLNTPFIDVPTVGGGGGSIARVDAFTNELSVGPESAGAMPGPVCYDMGGVEPTVTDADLVLGVIDPDFFLGGRRVLNKDKAWTAIKENVATPLGVSVEEAALSIRNRLIEIGADAVRNALATRKLDPSKFVLFAFGGAGGSFSAEIGALLKVESVYAFDHSAVFSARGLSTADVVHNFETSIRLPVTQSAQAVNAAIERFEEAAARDMRGEGFSAENVSITIELELNDGKKTLVVVLPGNRLNLESDRQTIERACGGQFANLTVDILRLRCAGAVAHSAPIAHKLEGSDASTARKGTRSVFIEGRWQQTPIYDRAKLRAGNDVQGPAIVEAVDSTYVVPAGTQLRIDKYLNAIMQRHTATATRVAKETGHAANEL